MAAKVHHKERAPAALLPFIAWWEKNGDFDIVVAVDGGNRTDDDQLRLWMKGRQLLNGVWHITVPGAVVTYAMTAEDSAHGHSAAIDVYPVRTHFANGLPATVYMGSDTEGVIAKAEGLRLMGVVGAAAKSQGLEWGGDFHDEHGKPRPDRPHLQLPGWRAMPRYVK